MKKICVLFLHSCPKFQEWWERKVDSCPLYLLDLFLLHPKELTNSIHESTCSFNLEVSNIESGSLPHGWVHLGNCTTLSPSDSKVHGPPFSGESATPLWLVSWKRFICFFFLHFANLPLESSAPMYHLHPFTSLHIQSTDQGPDGTPNIPKPKLQREAAKGFDLVTRCN